MDLKRKSRHIVLLIFLIIVCCVFIYRLFSLQIVGGEAYYEQSSKNIIEETDIIAPRGNIYDRNGVLIAGNTLSNDLKIRVNNFDNDRKNNFYEEVLNLLDKNEENIICEFSDYFTFNPIKFWTDNRKDIKDWQMANFNIKEPILEPLEFYLYLKNNYYKIKNIGSDELVYKIMAMRFQEDIKRKYESSFLIAEDVSDKTIAEVTERSHELSGAWLQEVYKRKYYNGEYIAHVLGYYGIIQDEKYQEVKNEGYTINSNIGRNGIELQAERYLKGTNGKKWLEQDANGNFMNEIIGIPAIPGNDVILTIDMKIQKVAVDSLAETINSIKNSPKSKKNFNDANAGAVVAIDVNTGEIIAMVSYPTYDPSIFLSGTDTYDITKILELNNDDKDKPLFQRAIRGTYAPGSSFKPLTAIAALEEGIITKDTIINDVGYWVIDDYTLYCLEYLSGAPHGRINLKQALATSCNIFFHIVGHDTGINNLSKWAGIFRLGELTGIDLPYEIKGTRPSKEYKQQVYNDIWRPLDTAQISIGQLYNDYTPLQLASYVSSIANGGTYYRPHIIKSIQDKSGTTINSSNIFGEKLPVKEETINAVKEGMVAVANSVDGTAVRVFKDFPFEIAGKTGTAETGREDKNSSNALFISYAPADNPKIAIAVVIENGVWGSWTAPVAKDIMEKYFEIYGDELYNKGNGQNQTLSK